MPFTFDCYSPSHILRFDEEEHTDKVSYILQRVSSACDRLRMRFPQTSIKWDSEQTRATNHTMDLLRLLNSERPELEGNEPSKRKTFASPSEDSPSEPPLARRTFVLAHRIITIPSGPRAKRIFWGLPPSQVRDSRLSVSSIAQGELRISDPLDASLPGVTTCASG